MATGQCALPGRAGSRAGCPRRPPVRPVARGFGPRPGSPRRPGGFRGCGRARRWRDPRPGRARAAPGNGGGRRGRRRAAPLGRARFSGRASGGRMRLGLLGSRLATAVAVLAVVGGCVSGGGTPSPTARPTPSPAASSSAAAGTSRGSGCPTSAPPAMAAGETATVTMETSKGTIVIKVEGKLGPQAAGNFFALAKCGFYDGVVFHRVTPGFVIQGGDGQGSGSA